MKKKQVFRIKNHLRDSQFHKNDSHTFCKQKQNRTGRMRSAPLKKSFFSSFFLGIENFHRNKKHKHKKNANKFSTRTNKKKRTLVKLNRMEINCQPSRIELRVQNWPQWNQTSNWQKIFRMLWGGSHPVPEEEKTTWRIYFEKGRLVFRKLSMRNFRIDFFWEKSS